MTSVLFETTTPKTKREIVLALLQEAGDKGVSTNAFLRRGAGSRFGGRIHELRQFGWIIEGHIAKSANGKRRSNGYVYVLRGFDQAKAARFKGARA